MSCKFACLEVLNALALSAYLLFLSEELHFDTSATFRNFQWRRHIIFLPLKGLCKRCDRSPKSLPSSTSAINPQTLVIIPNLPRKKIALNCALSHLFFSISVSLEQIKAFVTRFRKLLSYIL